MSDVNIAITIFFCMFLIYFSVDFYYDICFVFYKEHITVIFFLSIPSVFVIFKTVVLFF